MPDVYSISSERLIRLVFVEGHAVGQYVWTPAAPDMSSSLYTHVTSLRNLLHDHLQKSQGSSCQVAVNRSHLHKTKHMAVCNVKWDALVPIRDLWLIGVRNYGTVVVEKKSHYWDTSVTEITLVSSCLFWTPFIILNALIKRWFSLIKFDSFHNFFQILYPN